MPTPPASIRARIGSAVLRTAFALPRPVRRLLAGRPVEADGQRLAPQAQLLLRLLRAAGRDELWTGTVAGSRAALEESAHVLDGTVVQPVVRRAITIPGPAGELTARLYTPAALPPGSPLVVYYHGGGWVLGSLDTHDNLCGHLALTAGVRVLSVDYRLAPEHPFPAAVHDAFAAYDHAVRNAGSWDADPAAVAVAGDSAGANLAAVVAASAGRSPACAMLLYPRVDLVTRRRSQELFGAGHLLTEASMHRVEGLYVDPAQASDPRASVLFTADLSGFPPTYLATAGFDPLRDEGEAFAAWLAAAGVPVLHSRHPDLIHGYATMFPLGGRFHDAVTEATTALRTQLALRDRSPTGPATASGRRTAPVRAEADRPADDALAQARGTE
jgi:acetyl esterase